MKSFFTPKSSRVSQVTFDDQTGELTVEFSRGGTYVYHNVPSDTYSLMVTAESVGKFLNEEIKPRYGFTRLE
jgi:hypothetical protein